MNSRRSATAVVLFTAHYDDRGRVNEIRPKIAAHPGSLVVVALRGTTKIPSAKLRTLTHLTADADVVLVAGAPFAVRETVTTALRAAGIKARFATPGERGFLAVRGYAS
jgi:hypothetical protein